MRSSGLRAQEVNRVFVRSTNWIGDAVMTTPALLSLRKNFPAAHIALAARPGVAQVFEQHPALDEIMTLGPGKGHWAKRIYGEARLIRCGGFDLGVLMPNSFNTGLSARLAGLKQVIAYDTDGRRLFLGPRVRRPDRRQSLRHEIHYYQDLLAGAGLTTVKSEPCVHLNDQEKQWATGELSRLGVHGSFRLGLAPGAAYGAAKRWPAENFAQSAGLILDERPGAVFVFGSQAEAGEGRQIEGLLGVSALNLCGATSLRQAMALIARCDLFLSNDSGLMHLAAALGVPVVAIFGPTNPQATGPRGPRTRVLSHHFDCAPCLARHCPRGDQACMKAVTVQEVSQAALELLTEQGG